MEKTIKKDVTAVFDGELCDWRNCDWCDDYNCLLYGVNLDDCNDGDECLRCPACLTEFGTE